MRKDAFYAGLSIWVIMVGLTYLFFAFTSMSWDYLGGDNSMGRFLFGLWGSIWGLSIFSAIID